MHLGYAGALLYYFPLIIIIQIYIISYNQKNSIRLSSTGQVALTSQ